MNSTSTRTTTRTVTTRTTLRVTLVAGAIACVTAATVAPSQAGAATTTSPSSPAAATTASTTATTTARLAGADRYGTAVAISRHRFPTGAKAVYLVNGSASVDAISAGMVDDGPILLVPGSGAVPSSVLAEIRRLAPSTVYAVGGTGVVPASTLQAAAQGRATVRIAGADRFGTAAALARRVYRVPPTSGDHATLFVSAQPSADAVVAGVVANPGTPVLPLPATGPVPAVIKDAAAHMAGGLSLAVGGSALVPDAAVRSAMPYGHYNRLAGADRYATAVAVATAMDPGQSTVYLANGQVFADALSAGTLTRGPVLLVPKDGVLPQSVAAYLRRTHPTSVIALGGTGSVSDRMLTAAKNATQGRMPTVDVVLHNPYVAKDQLAPGWKVVRSMTKEPEVTQCVTPSWAATVPNTYTCSPSADFAVACYRKTGYSDVVTCIADPWQRTLFEYRSFQTLGTTPVPPVADRVPFGVTTPAHTCLMRGGGAWAPRGNLVGWASCEDGTALWEDSKGTILTRTDGNTVQYLRAPFDTSVPAVWADAQTRFWLG